MERANVDTTETITHVGLCAGYGGIELGLKRVLPSLRTIALCEIESFAIANLVAKMEAGLMDAAPVWTDLKTFPWESFRDRVDILTGGYPCQPFSAAGKRAGKEDPRHLWPWIADGIRILRPRVCFFENVEGHISLGLREVIGELESMGYKVSWGIFSAREVGAPHQRKRVFILAYRRGVCAEGANQDNTNGLGLPIISRECCVRDEALGCGDLRADVWPSRPGEPQHGWEPPRVVANGKESGWPSGRVAGDLGGTATEEGCRGNQPASPATDCGGAGAEKAMGNAEGSLRRQPCGVGSEESQHLCAGRDGGANGINSKHETQPPLGGSPNGPADWMDYAELYTTCDNRTDELRLLGNGVVPATAERAFRTLIKELL
jgi:DNA (cytosine-5)-methyltransferase 1